MPRYVPRKGDYVAACFDPQSGHEQKGRRPALVISKTVFNEKTGLAILCPITNTDRGLRLHVPIDDEPRLSGFVMVEQVKSIDFRARKVQYIATASDGVLAEVLSRLDACIY